MKSLFLLFVFAFLLALASCSADKGAYNKMANSKNKPSRVLGKEHEKQAKRSERYHRRLYKKRQSPLK